MDRNPKRKDRPISAPAGAARAVPWPRAAADDFPGVLDHEIAAEKAAALGRAGRKVEETLARLNEGRGERQMLLQEAADAVYAYFIQRELCGMRRHEAVIRDYGIPGAVLARLGAR